MALELGKNMAGVMTEEASIIYQDIFSDKLFYSFHIKCFLWAGFLQGETLHHLFTVDNI